ncbi:hypothetical protein F4815DRAFT_454604 [Daldinia loculata]|nr:hypothetical protein F4815DRAFT_454604 [Daldinia loculata]
MRCATNGALLPFPRKSSSQLRFCAWCCRPRVVDRNGTNFLSSLCLLASFLPLVYTYLPPYLRYVRYVCIVAVLEPAFVIKKAAGIVTFGVPGLGKQDPNLLTRWRGQARSSSTSTGVRVCMYVCMYVFARLPFAEKHILNICPDGWPLRQRPSASR